LLRKIINNIVNTASGGILIRQYIMLVNNTGNHVSIISVSLFFINAFVYLLQIVSWDKGKNCFSYCSICSRPRNQLSRPSTIDLRQIPINSIDRFDF